MGQILVSLSLLGLTLTTPLEAPPAGGSAGFFNAVEEIYSEPLAKKTLDLTNRYPEKSVNEVFADNILLNLHYLKGDAQNKPDWEKVRQPFETSFVLKPNEAFAFHEDILPEFKGKIVKTTGAHFNWEDGFKSDGFLVGDGVCHLATLINWVAQEARLKVTAPSNHNFLPVPGVPREFGTAIFWLPQSGWKSQNQNLYIENTFNFPVKFTFKADSQKVEVAITKIQ